MVEIIDPNGRAIFAPIPMFSAAVRVTEAFPFDLAWIF